MAELLPTVRSRLFALVALTLVPAVVILAYDEWLARQRGLEAFNDVAMRVVCLMVWRRSSPREPCCWSWASSAPRAWRAPSW